MGTLLKNKIFAEVNNDKNIVNELIKNYGKITFQGDKLTLWYNGMPYGTAYYKITDGQLSNSSQNHYCDVFGTVRDHQMTKDNINYAVIMGSNNQASVDNSLALGKYNKSTENIDGNTKNYIFSIGNGTGTDIKNRSNLLQVDTEGKLTTSYISYTMLDTSYVSSLGQDATMNIVMEALLTAPEYYAPQSGDFSIISPGIKNIAYQSTLDSSQISITWKTNKPYWCDEYVIKQVTSNTVLPNNVKLEHLSYTDYLTNSTKTKPIEPITIKGNKPIYGNNNKIEIILPQRTEDSSYSERIYKNQNDDNYTFSMNYNNIGNITNAELGYYTLVDDSTKITIYYGGPQTNYFSQLVDKNVFVKNKSKAFKPDSFTLTIPTSKVYVGLYSIFGVYASDTPYTPDNIKNIINDANLTNPSPQIFSETYSKTMQLFTANIVNGKVNENPGGVTFFTNSLLNINSVTQLNSKLWKHFFLGLPKDYCDGYNTDINANTARFWIKPEGLSDFFIFNGGVGDPANYVIETDLQYGNKNIPYVFFIGKYSGTLKEIGTKDQLKLTNVYLNRYPSNGKLNNPNE